MNAKDKGLSQSEAADVAEFSVRTAQRMDAGNWQPRRGQGLPGRTRPDPLERVWEEELEPMLKREPRLKPMTLFEHLQEKYPGEYGQVLRTLQRRVRTWKALYGPAPEVILELRHDPGMHGYSDFTKLKGVEVTINGKPYEHLIYQYRLAYSGWRYAELIEGGESFVGLSEGLQNALFACGGVPKQHRTDSLSAAYRQLGGNNKKKRLTLLYEDLCHHYRLEPTRNNLGIAHENGSIEGPHGHLKNRIVQALYLRGSNDFASVSDYQDLIDDCVAKLNRQHQDKYEEEKKHLQPLPRYRCADYELLTVRVSRYSTVEVRSMRYSVPARLIGHKVELHLHHNRIEGYLAGHQVFVRRRIRSKDSKKRRDRSIHYRDVIESLRKKPLGFLHTTWQEDLLPNGRYHDLWKQLKGCFDRDSAAVVMVESLYIAASQDKEALVADYLEEQLAAKTLTLERLRLHFQLLTKQEIPQVNVQQHDLTDYDSLFGAVSSNPEPESHQPQSQGPESLSESQPPAQASPTLTHAPKLGNHRATSHERELVLRAIPLSPLRTRNSTAKGFTPPKSTHRSPTAKRKNGFQFRLEPSPSG